MHKDIQNIYTLYIYANVCVYVQLSLHIIANNIPHPQIYEYIIICIYIYMYMVDNPVKHSCHGYARLAEDTMQKAMSDVAIRPWQL